MDFALGTLASNCIFGEMARNGSTVHRTVCMVTGDGMETVSPMAGTDCLSYRTFSAEA